MKTETKHALSTFLMELMVYAALVALYYFAVLHLIGGWLQQLFQHHRQEYAAVALGLVVGQGLVLEMVTRALVSFLKPRTEI